VFLCFCLDGGRESRSLRGERCAKAQYTKKGEEGGRLMFQSGYAVRGVLVECSG
jgi:hypothetical protein